MFCHLARLVLYTCWRQFNPSVRVERFVRIEQFVRFARIERFERFVRIERFERFVGWIGLFRVNDLWRLALCLDVLAAKDSLCCDAARAGS
jgi:hypothetical protein